MVELRYSATVSALPGAVSRSGCAHVSADPVRLWQARSGTRRADRVASRIWLRDGNWTGFSEILARIHLIMKDGSISLSCSQLESCSIEVAGRCGRPGRCAQAPP